MNAEDERQRPGADALPGRDARPRQPAALEQPFDAGSLYALRAAVAAHAAGAGLSRLRVYDVTAVAHELAANAVVHGAGHGLLRLWADEGFLYCEVSDQGLVAGGIDGAPAPSAGDGAGPAGAGGGRAGGQAVPASASNGSASDGGASDGNGSAGPWRAQRGHGLWLAGQVTDQLSIDHGPSGTTATARFPLDPG